MKEAELNAKIKEAERQAYEKDQEQRREKGSGLTVLLNRIVLAGTVFLILIAIGAGSWFYFRNRATQNQTQEFVANTEKIMQTRGWSFSFQPYDRPWEGMGSMFKKEVKSSYPEGFVEIKGNANETRWTLEMTVKRESTRGYFRSPQDFWLKNSSYSRLTIPTKKYNDDAFVALIEIPKSFPDKLKSALALQQVVVEKNYFADITAEADRDILHEYIYVLFDPYQYKSALHRSNQTQRWGEQYSNTLLLTISNAPNTITQVISEKVKADLKEIGKSEKGGCGILISRESIMISTLSVSLKPDDIQRMVDLGMMLKTEIDKKH